MTFLVVAALGGLGAATRFAVDVGVRARWPGRFPLGVLVVNVSGSFLAGVLVGVASASGATWPLLAATGFCGGYTTFSTAMLDTVRAVQDGDLRRAATNAVGSLVLCVAAAAAGSAVGLGAAP